MKTLAELKRILSSVPWDAVNAHVHTHLCDGAKDMNVENIARVSEEAGIRLVILTPHFHKQVSDFSDTLYTDTDEAIFLKLREEIDAYHARGGKVRFLLSTEADILNEEGETSLRISKEAEDALDLVDPTLNYHPLLPLRAVRLTYGRFVDSMHSSGEYARLAEAAGGIPRLLDVWYEPQANAILKCPYPAMLGHFLAAHSIANDDYSWFAMRPEHLPIMKSGTEKVIAACQKTGAMIDASGLHPYPHDEAADHKHAKDGFFYDFQKWFFRRCAEAGVPAYPGSDAHSLDLVPHSLLYAPAEKWR